MNRMSEERLERIRRKKKRILKRKLKRFCKKLFLLILLAVAAWNGIAYLRKDGNLLGKKIYDMEPPVSRTEEEVLAKLKERAEEDKEYEEILENPDDWPEAYLAALANNPEMLEYVKGYPDSNGSVTGGLTKKEKSRKYPLFIQWDERWGYASYGGSSIGISGCGPTCLSMTIFALTKDETVTPDKVARYSEAQGYYVEGTGTSWTLMTEGAASFGVTGTELSLSEDIMKRELDAGHPIICAMGPGDFTAAGHFIMIYGYNKDGFSVNDPNCRARSEKAWTYAELSGQIKNLWAFSKND